ncbi:MAG: GWxTD domain-containing protein, partial [Acidobacteriota bacterium]
MIFRQITSACHFRGGFPHRIPWLALAGLLLLAPSGWASQGKKSAQDQAWQEEAATYYKKWIEEDVVYIVSPDEKAVFDSLTTTEEKDQFIEQFWHRRDPSPTTIENEFKIEHYRRIAYVNERYFSGVPGWKTDRGKIYIRFGPPDSKERQPYGGPYRRPASEGGGETTVFPFEKWWYAHIEGIGDDIEIEFVDKNFTNEYRISINPNDKDAFLFTPGHGNTQDEIDGITSRFDRISAPMGVVDQNAPQLHRRDLPFVKLRRWAQLQKNPEIRNKRLQAVIDANVRYDQFPFQYRVDWLRLGDKALVPLTVSVEHSDLHFGEDGLGGQARVNLFGRVKNLQGRIVSIFEDEIVQAKRGEAAQEGRSLYQKILVLDPGRYRLDLILEDTSGGRLGTAQS